MKGLDESVEGIVKELREKEKNQDEVIRETRELVRACSVCIKHLHSGEKKEAEEKLEEVESRFKKVKKLEKGFKRVVSTSYQEYVEAKVLILLMNGKKIPSFEDLCVPFEIYLLGILDCMGELRREMLEALKREDNNEATRIFDLMNGIYISLMPLRFSESLLPGFRRKQDVARMQVEQARSELLRHTK